MMYLYVLGTSVSSVQGPDDLDLSLPRWFSHETFICFLLLMCWNRCTKALGSGVWWPARGLAPGYATWGRMFCIMSLSLSFIIFHNHNTTHCVTYQLHLYIIRNLARSQPQQPCDRRKKNGWKQWQRSLALKEC
jgi:hypothetical protein